MHLCFNDLGFSYSQEWAVTDKGLIHCCMVEWIRGGGTACSSNSEWADWLPISKCGYILATTQWVIYPQLVMSSKVPILDLV